MKALGRKSEPCHDYDDDDDDDGDRQPHPPQRSAIITGFNYLKKELSILSPLRHPCVIELLGISMEPLGLILELAPRSSLKSVIKEFEGANNHLQPAAIQAVTIQVHTHTCTCTHVHVHVHVHVC